MTAMMMATKTKEMTLTDVVGEEWSEELIERLGAQIARSLEDVDDQRYHDVELDVYEADVDFLASACMTFDEVYSSGDGWTTPIWYDIVNQEIEVEYVVVRTEELEYCFDCEELDKVTIVANKRL